MIQALAILFIGFSVFSALSMALTHFRRDDYRARIFGRRMGYLLLLSLATLQIIHFFYLQYGSSTIHSPCYLALLFTIAPIFYLFAGSVLFPEKRAGFSGLLHFIPAIAATQLDFTVALPLSFMLGAVYLLWLGRNLYQLRQQRLHFRLELGILSGIIIIALGVTLLGFALPLMSEKLFFSLYACAIGMAFLLVDLALAHNPGLSSEISEAAQELHHSSSLTGVDCKTALSKLDRFMRQEQLFQQPDLNLRRLAEQLDLSTHQLSELINSHLGKGFSRYIREHRIALAKKLLVEEKSASVLSIGLSSGFSSQSNFYAAFHEIEGMTPGRYRKLHQNSSPE
jgi:AraC-like DNA-binding protein